MHESHGAPNQCDNFKVYAQIHHIVPPQTSFIHQNFSLNNTHKLTQMKNRFHVYQHIHVTVHNSSHTIPWSTNVVIMLVIPCNKQNDQHNTRFSVYDAISWWIMYYCSMHVLILHITENVYCKLILRILIQFLNYEESNSSETSNHVAAIHIYNTFI